MGFTVSTLTMTGRPMATLSGSDTNCGVFRKTAGI
jgi:hypothetical protein